MSRMNLLQRRALLLGLLAITGVARAQTEPVTQPATSIGEVTARDVYVRCGASQNHYPVCKLQPGDRVTIVAEQGEWLQIHPPKGAFSLVSGEFIDTVDNQSGVVNGENVRVRAGSSLTDDRYQVQAQLRKGDKVRILGKNDDGFVRIEPPAGTTMWINKSFVERLSEARLKLEAEGIDSPTPTNNEVAAAPKSSNPDNAVTPANDAAAATLKKDTALASHSDASVKTVKTATKPNPSNVVAAGTQSDLPSPLSNLPPTEARKALEDLDRASEAEVARPVSDRNLEPLIAGYQRIAGQSEDELAQRYAEARVSQLTQMNELVATVKRMRELSESTDAQRRKMMEDRANATYTPLPTVLTGYDAQGELRTSALYPVGSQPRRFRLVDPTKAGGQTIGYLEVPSDSPIQVEAYLGRFVGVKAIEKRIQNGGVNPIPLYIVREVTPLEPTAAGERSAGQS